MSEPRRPRETLSAAAARRVALAAQGFAARRPETPDAGDLKRLTRRLGAVQIDSVNVLVRSHYLPAFSRLGSYPRGLLDQAAYAGRRRHLFEYWGHEASLLPVEHYPLFRWRMAAAERLERIWAGIARTRREQAALVARVLDEVGRRGALAASELEAAGRSEGPWWGWSKGKRALEYLFWAGHLTTAGRRHFERVYDLPDRVLPRAVLAAPTPDEAEAQRRLLMIAARALGVATEPDLRDYFRLPPQASKQRLAELVEADALAPVAVEGWRQPAYLHPAAAVPRRIAAQALLSPFDSLIWERARTERLWGFRYRLEIYTPGPKRVHGYYVLPFLLDESLVGRVDLKADRAAGRLMVQAAHGEPGIRPERVAPALLAALAELARWLGLARIEMAARGDLAETLRRHHAVAGPRDE